MRRTLISVLCLLTLTACDTTQSLKELRLATPPEDAYQAALAGGYQNLAEAKARQYQWTDSEYFADKGLLVVHGAATQPEQPTAWGLPDAALPEFNGGRTRLLAGIEANRTTQPALTAEAVVNYDRWVVAAHNEENLAAITTAHDAFFNSLSKLESVHVAQPGLDALSSEPTGNAAIAPTILYFPFNSDALGKGADVALSNLAKLILGAGKVTVNVNGHTDRSGPEVYNIGLSERRARFVLKALEKAGAPGPELHPFGFGESDPAVPTADGVREPRNRRVEVVIER